MKKWKEAYWLAKFELRESKLSFLLLFLFYPFITLGLISSFNSYLNTNFVGIDFFFMLLFTFASIWTKPKHFQVQQLNDRLVVSPSMLMLQSLPIAKDTIIKSRFIIYFVYSVPPQIFLLTFLYLFSPSIQEMMGVSSYISFAIIWLSFSVYAGGVIPTSDAGDKASQLKVAIYGVLMLVSIVVFFTLFTILSKHGMVHWTLIFAQKYPLLSSILSIILAFIGLQYWQSYMKKMIGKLDYL